MMGEDYADRAEIRYTFLLPTGSQNLDEDVSVRTMSKDNHLQDKAIPAGRQERVNQLAPNKKRRVHGCGVASSIRDTNTATASVEGIAGLTRVCRSHGE